MEDHILLSVKKWYKSEERQVFEKWWYGDKYEDLTETTGSYEETNGERSSDSANIDEKHSEYSDVSNYLDFDNLIIRHNVCSPDATPVSGNLSFDCEADSAFELVKKFLGSKKVHLYIEWTVKGD